MKSYYVFFVVLVFISYSCKKNPADKPNANIKIEFIAGNNQSDTIGRFLKDSLEFSVTRNGVPYPFPYIYISLPNCSGALSAFFWGNSNGVCKFPWQLNSTVGSQTITIHLIDSLGNRLDSISANATGISYDHGWMPADCVQSSAAIFQLPTGRILNYADPGIYFSDNNGSSWDILPSFPDPTGQSYKFSIYGQNIFALNNFNLWYSPDNGSSWQSLNNIKDSVGYIISLGITGTGKVFFNTSTSLYMSTDFLKTWIPKSLPITLLNTFDLYSNVIEAGNGILFLIGEGGNLFQSTDLGTTWGGSFSEVSCAFADKSGDVYLGQFNDLYRLSNPGQPGETLTLIKSFPSLPGEAVEIKNIIKVNNNYYFYVPQYGLMETPDFVSFKTIYPASVFSFCITKSNTAIVAGDGNPIIYNRSYFPVEYNLNP